MTVLKFNLVRVAVSKPESVAIVYHGKCYRYHSCAECGAWFWKSTDDKFERVTRLYRVYCSEECYEEAQDELTAARAKRYRIAYDVKHGKGAYYRRYQCRARQPKVRRNQHG